MDSGSDEDHHDENEYNNDNYNNDEHKKCGPYFWTSKTEADLHEDEAEEDDHDEEDFWAKVLEAICSIGIMSTKLDTVPLTSARWHPLLC